MKTKTAVNDSYVLSDNAPSDFKQTVPENRPYLIISIYFPLKKETTFKVLKYQHSRGMLLRFPPLAKLYFQWQR